MKSNFPSDTGLQKQRRLADRANTLVFWEKFEEMFPTEEACVDNIFACFAEDELIVCHRCNSSETEKIDLRSFRCMACRKKSYFTKGSFFQYIRRLKAMMGAIWLLENGVRFSACHFAELAGIAKSTATGMVKKVAMLILRTMDDAKETVNSSQFLEIFIRRSICTPALEHPRFEQKIAEEDYLKSSPEKQIEAYNNLVQNLSPTESTIYEQIDFNPKHRDSIEELLDLPSSVISGNLTFLELKGLVNCDPGERYSRPRSKIFVPCDAGDEDCPSELKVNADSIVEFVKSSMHGVARKYLQLYVSVYLCQKDRAKWRAGTIAAAGRRSKPVFLSEVAAYVTPLFVQVGRLSEPLS